MFGIVLLAIFVYGIYIKNKYIILLSVAGACVLGIAKYIWYKEDFEIDHNFKFRDDDGNIAESPEMYCGDSQYIPPDYDVMGTRFKCLKKGVGIGMNTSDEKVEQFLDKRYIPPTVKLYCGDKPELPHGYGNFGTKTQCLKKGVGIGMSMPMEKRRAMQERPPTRLGKREIIDLANRLKIDTHNLTRGEALHAIGQGLVQ